MKKYQLNLTEAQLHVLKILVEFHMDDDEDEDFYERKPLKELHRELEADDLITLDE